MTNLFIGFLAGLIATVPMTLFMIGLFGALPRREQYPLPPREVTMNVADKFNFEHKLGEPKRHWFTIISHFGYGAIMGGIYAVLIEPFGIMSWLTGVLFGLLVWAISYIIALPLLNLFPLATLHPPRRNLLMIGAHIVWGAVLGITFELIHI